MLAGVAVLAQSHKATEDVQQSPIWQTGPIVAGLRQSRDVADNIWQRGPNRRAPSREALADVMKSLTETLFPRHYGRADIDGSNIDAAVANTLRVALDGLLAQVHRGFTFVADGAPTEQHFDEALAVTHQFAARLPEIRGH